MGVVCGDVYYYSWEEDSVTDGVRYFGIRMIDLGSDQSKDFNTTNLFQVLACDPKHADKLLGIDSFRDLQRWQDVYILKSLDLVTQEWAEIGTFPTADGPGPSFSFTQDNSEVWAVWPNFIVGGHVDIMNTSNGVVKTSDIAFSGKTGSPYILLPDVKRGIFYDEWGEINSLKWADIDVTDGRIEAKIGSTDASRLWQPTWKVVMCGSHLITFDGNDSRPHHFSLIEVSTADGVVLNSVNLLSMDGFEDHMTMDISGLACLSPEDDLVLV